MKFNNELFKDLTEKEWRTYMGTTSFEFFGLRSQQIPHALLKINRLLNEIKPARIIEIGAGDGGLSYLLGLYARIKGIKFHSFDIHDKGVNIKHLREVTDGFEVKDVLFDKTGVEYVAQLIGGEGLTLCLFDAGKHVDFSVHARHLKVGDYVMLHDFARDEETFEKYIKGRIWNWLECTYAQIEEEADKNNIVFSPWAEDCVWAIGYKSE